MSIPLYFADFWKEFGNRKDFFPAQLGYGLQKDGSARIPTTCHALCIIDDSVLCMPKEEALDALAAQCKKGCYLDFEQARTPAHLALISGLRKRHSGFFALPARFLSHAPKAVPVLSCARPCNNWHSLTQGLHRQYPRGWMLELTPWKHISPCRMQQTQGYLRNAVCRFHCENGITQYYDTKETLREKLRIAQQHGCVAAIALHQEWQQLPE